MGMRNDRQSAETTVDVLCVMCNGRSKRSEQSEELPRPGLDLRFSQIVKLLDVRMARRGI